MQVKPPSVRLICAETMCGIVLCVSFNTCYKYIANQREMVHLKFQFHIISYILSDCLY